VLLARGSRVLLVDADEQKSAWDWAQQRDVLRPFGEMATFSTVCMSGRSVFSNLMRMKSDYSHIIVDTGGRDTTSQRSAMCIADKVIFPFKPSSIDIWTMGLIGGILSECVNPDLMAYSVISQADPVGKDNQEALEILKEFKEIITLDCMIGNRKAFRNAAAEGLGVHELGVRDVKACREIDVLFDVIYS